MKVVKLRIYPTQEQEVALAKAFLLVRVPLRRATARGRTAGLLPFRVESLSATDD